MKKEIVFCIFSAIILNFICESSFAQSAFHKSNLRTWSARASFKTDAFIENLGQFDSWVKTPAPVKYAVNNSDKFFFTQSGLAIKLMQAEKVSKEQKDEMKRKGLERRIDIACVNMQWEGCSENAVLQASEASEGYYTFGDRGYENVKAAGCRKLCYKELYPGIDVEYIIPDEGGIKYSLILRPGADVSKVKMKYSGDIDKIETSAEGNILIRTAAGLITDHAPQTFYKDGEGIGSAFRLEGNTVSFKLEAVNRKHETVVIDPWTTTPVSLTTDNAAYDIDYDSYGNVYVSGGTLPFKLSKYSAAGAFLWTFTTPAGWGSPSWPTYTKFCLIRGSGSSFIGEAQYSTGNPRIMKISSGGTLLITTPVLPSTAEIWSMFYNVCTGQLIAFGGGTVNSNNMQMIADTSLSASTPKNYNGSPTAYNDIAIAKMDDNGDFYALMSSTQNSNMNHIQKSLASGNYSPPCAWDVNSGYNYNEAGNTGIPGFIPLTTYATVRANSLALNSSYLFSYDGKTLKAWNKSTGAMLGFVVVNASYLDGKNRNHEGIATDDCNNIYVGGTNMVHVYSFSGSAFTALAPITANIPNQVYDVQLDKVKNTLYVCGQGFVTVANITGITCGTAPTITVTSTPGSCTSSASATVTVTGGTPPYAYSWSNGQTSQSVSGLTSGTYTVLVKDNSCAQNIFVDSVVVTGNGIAIASTHTNASCAASDGTATATPASGTAPFTYSWSPSGGGNPTATGLSAGTYSVLITDASGCTGTSIVTVNSVNTLTLSMTSSSSACTSANGTASANSAGGTAPFTYSWSNGQTAQTATGLVAGNYTASVVDANGCTALSTVTVNSTGTFTLSISSTSSGCASSNGTATAISAGGTGPFTYNWNNGQTAQTATGLPAGSYSVFVLDANGCTNTQTVAITSGSFTATATPSTVCAGQNAVLSATGGTSYSWSNGQTTSAVSVMASVSATYSVIVSNGLCSDTLFVPLTVNPAPSVTISGNTTICAGDISTLTASGGSTYSWSTGATGSVITVGPSAVTAYTVTASSSSGCISSNTVSITIAPPPVAAVSGTTICAGQTATLSASGGVNYSWSNGNTTAIINVAPTINTTYSVIVSVGTCADTASATVSVNASPVISVTGNTVICAGDISTLTALGGTNYSWSNGSTSSVIQVSPGVTTTYTVSSSNSNCTSAVSVIVAVSPPPAASAVNAVICSGQTALLTASGGGTYLWSNGSTGSAINVSPVTNTTYSVIVSIGTCSDTASATVTVNPNPVASAWGSITITEGQSATLSASGGGAYVWSNGAVDSVIAVSPVVTTGYCVTVSIGNCTDTACVLVSVEPTDCSYADDQLFIPDAFSPNGDTKNDVLAIYYPDINCIKELTFVIYDRWGEKVFESSNIVLTWDGTYKGDMMNTAVFVYYLKVTFISGNETVRKGNVSLVR